MRTAVVSQPIVVPPPPNLLVHLALQPLVLPPQPLGLLSGSLQPVPQPLVLLVPALVRHAPPVMVLAQLVDGVQREAWAALDQAAVAVGEAVATCHAGLGGAGEQAALVVVAETGVAGGALVRARRDPAGVEGTEVLVRLGGL